MVHLTFLRMFVFIVDIDGHGLKLLGSFVSLNDSALSVIGVTFLTIFVVPDGMYSG